MLPRMWKYSRDVDFIERSDHQEDEDHMGDYCDEFVEKVWF